MTRRPAHMFPFTAIVGQEQLKTALLLNAVDHRVGGVLIRGEKGTAKSTAVRALVDVLPDLDVVEDCRFRCDPAEPGSWCTECRERREAGKLPKATIEPRMVDLPVSATEDRLVGTLDFEAALKSGERAFHPGLLAEANRGILYVDEVNLLDDHLVDTLLDAAAMGVNTVEREGVSIAHPARFILVGTMNPEEGEVRPQLLDRFGLCVEVEAVREPEARVEIMRRRRAFEDDSSAFRREWVDSERELATRVKHARLRMPQVKVAEEILYAIADLCIRAGVDGHRADHVMARAAAALAALDARGEVTLADVERVAPMVLAHRLRKRPFSEVGADEDSLRGALARALGVPEDGDSGDGPTQMGGVPGEGQSSIFEALGKSTEEDVQPVDFDVELKAQLDDRRRSLTGRRQESVTDDSRGRYRRSEPAPGTRIGGDVAIDATIRVAATKQADRVPERDVAVSVRAEDLQRKVRTRKVGATIVFCVDASGSMGASKRMEAAKQAVLELLVDAYQRRDRVSVVSFRGEHADVVLAPTASVELANLRLKSLPTGGATPLAAGLMKSLELIEAERSRQPESIPWLVLVTDGRGNVGLDGGIGSHDAMMAAGRVKAGGINAIVIDTGSAGGGAARELAAAAEADYVRLATLDGGTIAEAVRARA